MISRRAKAFRALMEKLPVTIRDNELIVGSSAKKARGCQMFPEFSCEWVEDEIETVATRSADPFYLADETKAALKEVFKYWKGKTTSDLATSYMKPETLDAIKHNIFTPGNYFYNGVGHVTVNYGEVLEIGFGGIVKKAKAELEKVDLRDADASQKRIFLEAVIETFEAGITYGKTAESFRLASDRKYLNSKCSDNAIAKVYQGYCFIVNTEWNGCVTVYKLPEWFGKAHRFDGKEKICNPIKYDRKYNCYNLEQ